MKNNFRNNGPQKIWLIDFLKTMPAFLLLLPVFFVLHEFTANYGAIPVSGAVKLCLLYLAVSCIIACLAWLFLRDHYKAAIMALLIMAYNLFYGSAKDWLHSQLPGSVVGQYRFIIPFTIIMFLLAALWLKRRKKPLTGFSRYLTILLTVLIVFDLGWLSIKTFWPAKAYAHARASIQLSRCDTCSKPDIFLIIPDEYTGNSVLKSRFNFDNSDFENELSNRGFHVSHNSKSNYNFTPYSVASTLNMDFNAFKDNEQGGRVREAYSLIRNNIVTNYLCENGYQFYNFSIFDFNDQPAQEYNKFMPTGIRIITAQTFTNRLEKDFRGDILAGKFGKAFQKKYAYRYLKYNDNIISLTQNISASASTSPKFVYAHLMLPHSPFFFDSKGNLSPVELAAGLDRKTKKYYTEYLLYANKKILKLVDHILVSSKRPTVIMVLSDHGYRHDPELEQDRKLDFKNLNAIYLPGGNYGRFYDSISNVNHFRAFFNTCFNQHIPLLKDSMVALQVSLSR